MTTRRRLLAALLAVPLAALTAACELPVPGQGPPPMLYRLTPKSTFGEDLPRVRWQLIIEVPVADAGLNTTRVALQRSPTQLEYYARSSWTDRAPVMVQTLMIESFENSQRIISVSAVGSLREELAPLHVVVPDQLIDRTRGRPGSFFGRGLVAHVAFDQPFCPILSDLLATSAQAINAATRRGGTSVVIEGPAFSTQAESRLYRSWNADIIGMTALPEAKLAREAEICYANLSLVTDYDAWHESREAVSAEMIMTNLSKNVETAKRIVAEAAAALPPARDCACPSALASALVTAPELVPEETKRDLEPLIGRYMPVEAGV